MLYDFHGTVGTIPSSALAECFRWSAEESRLLGAGYYVSQVSQEELDKIRLMLGLFHPVKTHPC